MNGCMRKLAPGQWWSYCGETDMGQTAPFLCTECGGSGKLEESATAQERKLREWDEACERVRRGGYVEPIPAPPDCLVWWPGKERGASKPPIIWSDNR